MNQATIEQTVEQMRAEFSDVAQKCAQAEVARDAAIARAARAEDALVKTAVTKVASAADFTTKVASLAGRLVASGSLEAASESDFVGRIVADPSELVGVCLKLAAFGGPGGLPGAFADPDSPAETAGDSRDPIERFMSR